MPTYGYECLSCKATFEVQQRITEDALTVHEDCGGKLRKLVYPVGIAFKGSGFYVNDYAPKSSSKNTGDKSAADAPASAEKSTTETSSTTDTATAAKPATEAPAATKTETKASTPSS